MNRWTYIIIGVLFVGIIIYMIYAAKARKEEEKARLEAQQRMEEMLADAPPGEEKKVNFWDIFAGVTKVIADNT